MAISMMPLLIHSEAVSPEVREALRAAVQSPPEARRAGLESAARMLHREASIDCHDVRELFGLTPKQCC